MSEQERVHYRVEGGAALAIIEAFATDQNDVLKTWRTFTAQWGAKMFYHDVRPRGLVFHGDPPKGWRQGPSSFPPDVYVPDRRTSHGQDVAKAFDALPAKLTGVELAQRLGGGETLLGSQGKVRWPVFERIGDAYVLSIPIGEDGEHDQPPAAVTRLKMSEYWALKEAVEAAKMEAAQ